jgi:hypothetical protein
MFQFRGNIFAAAAATGKRNISCCFRIISKNTILIIKSIGAGKAAAPSVRNITLNNNYIFSIQN